LRQADSAPRGCPGCTLARLLAFFDPLLGVPRLL
jgi:hypothetical protein